MPQYCKRDEQQIAECKRRCIAAILRRPVGGDIGLEAHPETDQFLRLDLGSGRVQMGAAKDKLTFEKEVSNGWCVLVPAGTWHNITNIGATPMQVYAIYSALGNIGSPCGGGTPIDRTGASLSE